MSAGDAGDEDLVAALRRSLRGEAPPLPAYDLTTDLDPPGEPARRTRAVSSAAMSIADQIIGLDGTATDPAGAVGRLGVASIDGTIVALRDGCVIGRRARGDGSVVVADGRVSRSHVRITSDRSGASAVDLGSSNGTFRVRDGEVIRVWDQPVELRAGDRLETVGGLLLAHIVELAE